jgi:hypothetical protein
MNIYLKLTLDCSPALAWDAIQSPAVFRAVSSPLLKMTSLEHGGFPARWNADGPHLVKISLLGLMPMGRQTIDVSFTEGSNGVRTMVDSGQALTGPLRITHDWNHSMAISAAASGQTLYRDRLVVKAGVATPFIWLGMWIFWQYRASRLRALAPSWGSEKS